ncbi:Uma2 family endonuclease [Catalinimonas niigatensis]|uniref:Uma2 family endonuclease n=1 Tax=Catalinimonas niigatensis TaxID=1397264 RepID=UPI0026666D61|nr:Uma2 family endonuclease [Catalinimonas niigatensis]WPP48104.1 Uma2 family endonuclease [Catalinimonas niigatensis]
METEVAKRLFTIEEYHQMAEAGILRADTRTELIHGEIIKMSPIGNYHAAIVRRITTLLTPLLVPEYIVDVQNPVRIGEQSEPEPDITILPFREDYYAATGVTPSDVLLLIEVSDSSLRYDREIKLPLYATAHIPEVWIIDVNKKRLYVYRQPVDGEYQEKQTIEQHKEISATQLPLKVMFHDLLI